MKLVTFAVATPIGSIERVGALVGERVIDLAAAYALGLAHHGVFAATELADATIPPDMTAFLARWPVAREAALRALAVAAGSPIDAAAPSGARLSHPRAKVRLLIPIKPRRIKDYLTFEQHKKIAMARRGLEMPELWYRMPTYTNRNIMGLANPEDDIAWPSYTEKLDMEFEIGLVVGKQGRGIKAADAAPYIAGFTIYNDFSARDIQADEGKIGAGVGKSKDFDQGNVMGPCIVTPDEIDPANMDLTLRVNSEIWARGNTSGMKFSWGQIIENASRDETIYPGDVFASGTMDRGCCAELERWIKPGDVIEMDAAGIGVLRNRVIRAAQS